MRWFLVTLWMAVFGCNGSAATATSKATEVASSRNSDTRKPAAKPARKDASFPRAAKKSGWKTVQPATRAVMDERAADYARFLANAKTDRRATEGLVAMFAENASPLPARTAKSRPQPNTRYYLKGPGGRAAAFVVVGKRPIEEGLRVVVVSIDAARIDLKQRPVYQKHGLTMLDTVPYGSPAFASWLTTPMALYIYSARPGAADGPMRMVIGEKQSDPVLVIPDLLPHLSRNVQRKAIVDSPERMDAVAARSQQALVDFLAKRGFDPEDFATAEASLLPAGAPVFMGVDRAEIAGYGHEHRALAYAATRELATSTEVYYTSVVIVVSKRNVGYSGSSGQGFARRAITAIVESLAGRGSEPAVDSLTTRRIFARSAALFAHHVGGKPAGGVTLSPASDDAMPRATRRVLDALTESRAHVQFSSDAKWNDPSRRLGTLDMDSVDIGLPVADRHLPIQRVSIYDLYQAGLAFRGWFHFQPGQGRRPESTTP